MKKLKRGVAAFLVGEFLTIFRTDKKFKKELSRKQGRDKISFAFEKLFEFNKQLVLDTKDSLNAGDIKKQVDHIGLYFQKEYELLKEHLKAVEKERRDSPKEALQGHLEDLRTRYESFKSSAQGYIQELDEKYALQEKIKELKEFLDTTVKKYTKESSSNKDGKAS